MRRFDEMTVDEQIELFQAAIARSAGYVEEWKQDSRASHEERAAGISYHTGIIAGLESHIASLRLQKAA